MRIFLVACCFILCSFSNLVQAQDDGWTVFRGNAESTGVAETELPDDLDVLWEYKIPRKNGAIEGTPLIVREPNGKLTCYIADLDGGVFSIDLESGKLNWESKLSISIAASPAYHNGNIYVGDIDGVFYCLNTKGETKWKYEAQAEISSANFFEGNVLFGSHDAFLYLLNGETGKLIWKQEMPDQIQCSVTVADDRAFVAGCDGFFHVISLKDGKEVGNVDIHSPTQSTPAVVGSQVFFGTEQAEFFSVNWKSVKPSWNFVDDGGQAAVRGSAAVTKEQIVFGARNRQVYSLDTVTGKQNWTIVLKANIDSSPLIVGKRVFVGSTDGRFYVLSLDEGVKLWEKQFKGGIIASPAAAFGRLVIATDEGVVYCLGKKTGGTQ